MERKPHRINARMTSKEYERARELLTSHKIYGVHSLSDVVSKAVWDLYDRFFVSPLEQVAIVPQVDLVIDDQVVRSIKGARKVVNSASKRGPRPPAAPKKNKKRAAGQRKGVAS